MKDKKTLVIFVIIGIAFVLVMTFSFMKPSPRELAGCSSETTLKNVSALIHKYYDKKITIIGMFVPPNTKAYRQYLLIKQNLKLPYKIQDIITLQGNDELGNYYCQANVYWKHNGKNVKMATIKYKSYLTDDKKSVVTDLTDVNDFLLTQ